MKASSQPIWSRSPALQTKPRKLATAIEWLTAFETKGILDLIAQFDFYKTVAMIQIESIKSRLYTFFQKNSHVKTASDATGK